MASEAGAIWRVVRVLLNDLTVIFKPVARTRNQLSLLFRQEPLTDLALEELDVRQHHINPMPENVTDELVASVFEREQFPKWDPLCDVLRDFLADSR